MDGWWGAEWGLQSSLFWVGDICAETGMEDPALSALLEHKPNAGRIFKSHKSLDGKASVYDAGDPGSIPGLGRSLGEGNGNPLQYYCLENPTDRGPW